METQDVIFMSLFIIVNIICIIMMLWMMNPIKVYLLGAIILHLFIILPCLIYAKLVLFKYPGMILFDNKKTFRILRIIETVKWYQHKLYIYCYNKSPEHVRTPKMEKRFAMAIRAIDSQRDYQFVFSFERRQRGADGKFMKKEDGEYDLVSMDKAVEVAGESGFTVVSFRIRTARAQAEERDRMLEFRSHKGEMVQKVASGTMDLNLLLNCLRRVDRLLPPIGKCQRCGIDHSAAGHMTQDGYLDFDKLVGSDVNAKVSGPQRMELVLDHLSDGQRVELANYIRNFDSTGELGED